MVAPNKVAPPQAPSPKKPPNIFDKYIERLNESLSSYDETLILDKLCSDMKDLDSLTVKLRGGEDAVVSPKKCDWQSTTSPRSRRVEKRPSRKPRAKSRSILSRIRKVIPDKNEKDDDSAACTLQSSNSYPPAPELSLALESFPGMDRSVSISVLKKMEDSRPSSATSSRQSVFDKSPKMTVVRDVAIVNIDPPQSVVLPLKLTPSLEALRKESIEQARKNIVALKGALMSEVYSLEGSSMAPPRLN